MLDAGKITGFDWDDGNSRKSTEKHFVTQREAEEIFQDSRLLVFKDDEHSQREGRFQAYGSTASGRKLSVAFTLRMDGTLIRIISARAMSRKERARYEEEA